MRARNHSRTAEATAAIRAGHLLYDRPVIFADPFAIDLTSTVWRTVCRHPLLYWPIVRGLCAPLRPVHGWILVRDQLTEESLRSFVEAGGAQYVLLGAGFDSTALRRPSWLAGTRIIEVDHPATQAVKLARIALLGESEHAPGFEAVPVNFERESLSDGLARSAFEATARSFFAWQGVVYYLSESAISATLSAIARASASGSELMFDFLLPPDTSKARHSRVMSLARAVTARMGERYISFHTPAAVRALLDAAGFEVIALTLDDALQARYCAGRNDDLSVMRGFGIAHARRR